MSSLNTYCLTWVSLTLDVGYLHGCCSEVQPLLLTLDEGYLLTATVSDLQRGLAPLGSPVPAQPPLLGLLLPAAGPGPGHGWLLLAAVTGLGREVASPGRPDLGRGVSPPGHHCPQTLGSSSRPPALASGLGGSSRPFLHRRSLALWAAVPDFGRGVALSRA